jgi:hypothetical protein
MKMMIVGISLNKFNKAKYSLELNIVLDSDLKILHEKVDRILEYFSNAYGPLAGERTYNQQGDDGET